MRARLLLAAVLAVVALGLQPGAALGHAQLVGSAPGAGELLAEPPNELRLVFSEPIEAGFSELDVVDGEGRVLADGVGEPDPADSFALVAPFSTAGDGVYTVNWRVLSASDGHVTSGFIVFGVGEVDLGGAMGGPADEAGELHTGHGPIIVAVDVIARTLSFGGLMLAFGLAVIGRIVLAPALPRSSPAVSATQALALLAAVVGSALGIWVGAVDLPGGSDAAAYVNGSRTGQLLGLRLVIALAGVGVTFALVSIGWAASGSAAAGATGLAGICLVALGGHASGYGGPAPIVADVVHLAAAGVWLAGVGTIAALVIGPAQASAPMAQVVPRFSALALVSIAMVVATGTYASWLATRDFTAISSPFTVNLALKVAAVGAALGLGGLNYLDGGRGRATLGGLRRRVIAEAALAGLVVLLAANLTSGSAPAGARAIEITPTIAGGDAAGARLAVQPGRPGPNRAIAELDSPQAVTAELILRRLDADTGSTRIALHPETASGQHGAHAPGAPDAAADVVVASRFLADGVALPADSRWDATVVLTDAAGTELSRQRFRFSLGDRGIVDGAASPIIDPLWLVPVGLLGLGLLGLSYWLGGGTLPRTEPGASRVALIAGGTTSVALGLVMLVAGAPA